MMNKKGIAAIGVGAGVLAGLATAGNLLLAPGTQAYGINVGGTSAAEAHQKVQEAVANHTVVVEGQELKLKELGYQLQTSEEDFRKYKALGGDWGNAQVPLKLSSPSKEHITKVVQQRVPALKAPENAQVAYQYGTWIAVRGTPGKSVDVSKLNQTLNQQFSEDGPSITESTRAEATTVAPLITDAMAEKMVKHLNEGTGQAKVTWGKNGVLTIPKPVASSFVQVRAEGNILKLDPQKEKIAAYVKTLPGQVNKEMKPGAAITDEKGKVLRTLVQPVDGVKLGDTASVERTIADAVAAGKFSIPLQAKVEPAPLDKRTRRAEVNLTTKHARFYENDKLVLEFPVGVGRADTPTDVGDFHVHSQLRSQDMGCSSGYDYCVKGVRWISYFNGGEAFHAAPWASNFGNSDSYISHGCVGMRMGDAEKVYKFLEVGSPVKVHR